MGGMQWSRVKIMTLDCGKAREIGQRSSGVGNPALRAFENSRLKVDAIMNWPSY